MTSLSCFNVQHFTTTRITASELYHFVRQSSCCSRVVALKTIFAENSVYTMKLCHLNMLSFQTLLENGVSEKTQEEKWLQGEKKRIFQGFFWQMFYNPDFTLQFAIKMMKFLKAHCRKNI